MKARSIILGHLRWPVHGAYASRIAKKNNFSGFNVFSKTLLLAKHCDYNGFFFPSMKQDLQNS